MKLIDTLYVWTVIEKDGEEGTIAAYLPALGRLANLVTRKEAIAKGPFREVALGHKQRTGRPVKLVKFTKREEMETI